MKLIESEYPCKLIKDLGVIAVAKTDKRRCAIFECECGIEFTSQVRYIKSGKRAPYCPTCNMSRSKKTHGLSTHPIYKAYLDMRRRCLKVSSEKYLDYGGRGIIICDKWLQDFKTFYDWSLPAWRENLTIDRKDVDGNYEPNNCRWLDKRSQAQNKRKYKNNTSGYIGVKVKGKYWAATARTWDNKPIYLGTYITPIEAARTRDSYYAIHGFVEMTLNNIELFNDIGLRTNEPYHTQGN